jgi:hypothetical protein
MPASDRFSALLSDGRLIQLLVYITLLLFVSRWMLPRGRGGYAWARWTKWGAIATFAAAVCYVLGLTLWWALGASR